MIAQVIFDLPLEGPFDYLVPGHLAPSIAVGMRVKVSFGARPRIGFVIGLLAQSHISKIKPIQSLGDADAVFNSLDLTFARDFCAYYGCSLGEGLSTMLRHKTDRQPSIRRDHKPLLSLYRCPPDFYAAKIQEIIDGYKSRVNMSNAITGALSKEKADAFLKEEEAISFLILVPDAFRGQMLSQQLHSLSIKIGTRSSVFECDGRFDCVMMVDEENSSYKQEQMPMYETRQVLLARSKIYGFDVAFVGISPSVELMALAREDKIRLFEDPSAGLVPARPIDLSNYKFVPGLLSPPVRDGIDAALKAGKKSILILNRMGVGGERLQTELKKNFPHAKIFVFSSSVIASDRRERSNLLTLQDFDILISTQAILRFQGMLKVRFAAFIDFDAQLNRLDMRSAFNAFSLTLHVGSMALDPSLIQTCNGNHYVLQSLSGGNITGFYDEELKLRKELGFSPFKHWVRISWRGKSEKSTHQAAIQVYNALSRDAINGVSTITPPLADAVSGKRRQFRFNVMVQADEVRPAVAFIKSTLAKIKRPSRVIVGMNVDP